MFCRTPRFMHCRPRTNGVLDPFGILNLAFDANAHSSFPDTDYRHGSGARTKVAERRFAASWSDSSACLWRLRLLSCARRPRAGQGAGGDALLRSKCEAAEVHGKAEAEPDRRKNSMRILITGADGQVGWECQRSLQALGPVHGVRRAQCDLTQPDSIRAMVRHLTPDLIVNAAAYTAVDRAEAEAAVARVVNAEAPAVLAEEAKRLGAAMIHLSTDYVFDGTKPTPYAESDACNPLSVYGRSKRQGEEAILSIGAPAVILRTSWVYAMRGHNFLRTIVRLAREREELRIVDDQWGAPTWARSIAEGIAAIAARAGRERKSVAASFAEHGGIFHMTAGGRTSWHRFAEQILQLLPDSDRRLGALVPIASAEYPTAARRPANSVLDCARLAQHWGVALPSWSDALALAVAG